MDDDDARRLRLYKEMYLPDGDLYSDGKGRTRQFRWRNLGRQNIGQYFVVTRIICHRNTACIGLYSGWNVTCQAMLNL